MVDFDDSGLRALADKVIPEEYFTFDSAFLRDEIFATDRMLEVKQRIFEGYRVSGVPLAEHLLECLALTGVESVLDLGCGNGVQLAMIAPLLRSGKMAGVDIAPGVLGVARQRMNDLGAECTFMEASADDLAVFGNDSFDRVMANYMLHYVPNIDRCISETRRVLRAGGRFICTTNSPRSMVEMYDVHFAALKAIGAPSHLFKASPKGRFSLENGEQLLSRHFDQIELKLRPDVIEFKNPKPFLEFYSVGHNFCSAASAKDKSLDARFFLLLYSEVERLVDEVISERGSFQVTKLTGSFVSA